MRGKGRKQSRGGGWGKKAVFAFLFCACACWVTFDSLFSPFAPQGKQVEIPDCRGMREKELTFADWLQVTAEYRHDGQTPAGVVIAQSPAGGSLRRISERHPTCRLTLVVSLGEEFVALPNVAGMDEREAEGLLRGLGFSVYVQRVPGAQAAGEVLACEPAPGTELPFGADVTLRVSEGTPAVSVTVPDLRGLTRAEALMEIWTARLSVGEVVEVPSPGEVGTVLRQSHLPGTRVSAGTKITVYVVSSDEDGAPFWEGSYWEGKEQEKR